MRSIRETARDIPVLDEVDVLVLGGGPAGYIAATAAARLGARTMLIERYGCMGGLATGGLVLHMMHIFDHDGRRWIGGLPWETMERVIARDGMAWEGPTRPHADSEILKVVADDMCQEAGVLLRLHSWAVRPILDGTRVTGVFVEDKTGRQAVLAKVCIDATGDGDIAALAGAGYDMANLRIGLPLKVGGVDMAAYDAFAKENPQEAEDLVAELESVGGFRIRPRPTPYSDQGIHWINFGGLSRSSDVDSENGRRLDGTDPRDLTYAETELRRRAMVSIDYYRLHVPGYEKMALLSFASQIGVRVTRCISGEHKLTRADVTTERQFEDVIGGAAVWFADVGHYQIPYGCLVPHGVEGLLVAGRCIGADPWIVNSTRLIPPAMVTGQAVGTAAALAVDSGTTPRELPIATLQRRLLDGGVIY